MDRVQRNGGTLGVIAAVILAAAFILLLSTGLNPEIAADPTKALSILVQHVRRFVAAGVLFGLGVAASVIFIVALSGRLREAAPTRAAAVLYLAVIGLTGYALDSLLQWQGITHLVGVAAKDQTTAANAWVTMRGLSLTFDAVGGLFTGATEVIAGWAILTTHTLGTAIGWLSIVTGIVNVLALFARASVLLFLGSFVLTVIWLAWTGVALRGVGERQGT